MKALTFLSILVFMSEVLHARDRAKYPDPLRRNVIKVARGFEKNGGYCKAYIGVDRQNQDGTRSYLTQWVRCKLENGRCPNNATSCWRNHKRNLSSKKNPKKNPSSCRTMRVE